VAWPVGLWSIFLIVHWCAEFHDKFVSWKAIASAWVSEMVADAAFHGRYSILVERVFMFLDNMQEVFRSLGVGTGLPQWSLLVSNSRGCWWCQLQWVCGVAELWLPGGSGNGCILGMLPGIIHD